MKLPLSWLQDFVDINGLSVEDIASKLTLAGLEVEEIHYAGWKMPDGSGRHEFKTTGIEWDRDKEKAHYTIIERRRKRFVFQLWIIK